MHTLHMIDPAPEKRVAAVRNVRSARAVLGDTPGGSLRQSLEAVDTLRAQPTIPVLVGRHPDLGVIQAAARELERDGVLRPLIDLSPEQVFNSDLTPKAEEVRSTDSVPEFSHEAYATALVLMAFTSGNPTNSLMVANTLMRTTGDAEFFDEVGDVLLDVFPGPTE